MDRKPKISVITVVFNNESGLAATLPNVRGQTYPNVEYIVIDGGSTDDTRLFLEQHLAQIDRLVSEPDKGIYDAMNKGLRVAGGEYVCFMNAGDLFYAADTLERIFQNYTNQTAADVYYGEAVIIDEVGREIGKRNHKKLPENLKWKDMIWGMVVCHQSLIVRRKIAPLYDLTHPYAGDIDWTIRVLKQARRVVNVHFTVCKFLKGGFSAKKRTKSLEDRLKISLKHFGWMPTFAVQGLIGVKYFARKAFGGTKVEY